MQKTIEKHGEMSCEIQFNETENQYVGILRYSHFKQGTITGQDLDAVRTQFQAICEMSDAGGMVRHGIIMLGYHNGDFSGDVLLVNGEIIGNWTSDELEWCHFTAESDEEITCSAPSPWMLHDSIANWLSSGEYDSSAQNDIN